MNVLIIFSSRIYPNRRTIMDHLHCFRRYSNCNVFHLNVATTNFNTYFRWLKWDVVIFHNTFLIRRQSPKDFSDLCNNVSFTKELKCQKFAIAQVEHNHTEVLKKFYKDFGIAKVFTVCPNDEQIVKIYGNSITKHIQFVRVLTGYADESLETLIRQYKPKKEREIVIGYRSFKARARLGKLGVMKWLIAEKFQEKLGKYDNLKFDISCDLKDNLSGDDWVKFLLSCKYQLGVEGGSSLHDPRGGIAFECAKFESKHPEATFEEIEKHCFPGEDGKIHYAMITPRMFECALTRTGMILLEGHYNGILRPNKHYLEVKRDFSNIEEVLLMVQDEVFWKQITTEAYKTLISSGKYSYKAFVSIVLPPNSKRQERTTSIFLKIILLLNMAQEIANETKFKLSKLLRINT